MFELVKDVFGYVYGVVGVCWCLVVVYCYWIDFVDNDFFFCYGFYYFVFVVRFIFGLFGSVKLNLMFGFFFWMIRRVFVSLLVFILDLMLKLRYVVL